MSALRKRESGKLVMGCGSERGRSEVAGRSNEEKRVRKVTDLMW